MTNTEKVLAALHSTLRPVSEIVTATGLSDSVVRKTLKTLVEGGQVTAHSCKPVLYSNPKQDVFSVEGAVEQVLGRRARSVDYLHKRIVNRGLTATNKAEVKQVLLNLVRHGRAVVRFRRFAKA